MKALWTGVRTDCVCVFWNWVLSLPSCISSSLRWCTAGQYVFWTGISAAWNLLSVCVFLRNWTAPTVKCQPTTLRKFFEPFCRPARRTEAGRLRRSSARRVSSLKPWQSWWLKKSCRSYWHCWKGKVVKRLGLVFSHFWFVNVIFVELKNSSRSWDSWVLIIVSKVWAALV